MLNKKSSSVHYKKANLILRDRYILLHQINFFISWLAQCLSLETTTLTLLLEEQTLHCLLMTSTMSFCKDSFPLKESATVSWNSRKSWSIFFLQCLLGEYKTLDYPPATLSLRLLHQVRKSHRIPKLFWLTFILYSYRECRSLSGWH